HNLTDYSASYTVFARPQASPSTGARSGEVNPWDSVASPYGWQDTNGTPGGDSNVTSGNNVGAQDDSNANDVQDGLAPAGGSLNADGTGSLNFDFPIDLADEPSEYRAASITNLYYWNNVLHDIHYRYGFDEAAGNFQLVNYSGQGAGNDFVLADAQDGGSVNNAFFSSPPDGLSGRMQMYQWLGTPMRDGDLDAQVIIHEYGHGVSNRLTGGPADANALVTLQSAGMGEGWSDWWALMLLQTDGSIAAQQAGYGLGTYVLGQPPTGAGIRRQPYSYNMAINSQTFAMYGPGQSTGAHNTGELWCSTLWDMSWLLIRKYGFNADVATGYSGSPSGQGNRLALRLVMDALKLQPANPTFIEARDAILLADTALTGGANQREIWYAFARRGLGLGATTPISNSGTLTVAYDMPAGLGAPLVTLSSPVGRQPMASATSFAVSFCEPMNPASFSVASDVTSFTGDDGADLKPAITGSAWSNGNKTLSLTFAPQNVDGVYSLTIGPNILGADDGSAMDQNLDGVAGQPTDTFTASVTLDITPGPDEFGYEASSTAYENVALTPGAAGVVTAIDGTDDGTANIPLGASTFSFYGTTYAGSDQLFINANGLITFGSSAINYLNTDMTTVPAQAAIAPLWDDWRTNVGANSAVLYKFDTAKSRLIIDWHQVPNFGGGSGSTTNVGDFQAILYLNTGSNSGDMVFNYKDLDVSPAGYSNGGSATVGVKSEGTSPGARRLLVFQNNGPVFLTNSKAVRVTATSVSGSVYVDADSDGVRGASETGLAGQRAYLDINSNSQFDAAEPSSITDADGQYGIHSLVAGNYTVRIGPISDAVLTTVASQSATIATGQRLSGLDFGAFPTAFAGTAANDDWSLRSSPGDLGVEIVDNGSSLFTASKTLLAGTTLKFGGAGGDDALVVDYVSGDPLDGGAAMRLLGSGDNSLTFTGNGSFTFLTNPAVDSPRLSLAANDGATVNLRAPMSRLTGVSALGARVDLFDNDLIVDFPAGLASVQSLINSARNFGNWDWPGLTSSTARDNAASNTTLAAITSQDYWSIYGDAANFDGQTLASTSILVKYTYYGDADFDGRLNLDDYAAIEGGYLLHRTGWLFGDFDGSGGRADLDDYSLIDAAFLSQSGVL
ncbi:MAG: M36 family metallopeptidase, partial [Tepidisphaeraceae bacterium]